MDRINGLKVLGFAGMIALGATFAVTSAVFAEDAKKPEAKKAEGKKEMTKKASAGEYQAWVKELGLDEATAAKLAEIDGQQKEAVKEKQTAFAEAKKDPAKKEEAVKLSGEIQKINAEYKAKALAVLSPEQQKKLSSAMAYKSVTMVGSFKQVELTADQQKKIQEKIEAAGDSLLGADKQLDSKKVGEFSRKLAEEILTADQKAVVTKKQEEAKAAAAAKKAAEATPAKADKEKADKK
jgi:Spy/CpxP family protein refolding chaperone